MKKSTPDTITVRLPPSIIQAIDNYRREADGLPSRPEVLRRAVKVFLEKLGHPIEDDGAAPPI